MNLKKILSPSLRGKLMYGLRWLPDTPYIKLFYLAATGKRLNLRNPKGYNEKLNWLKLHDQHAEYSELVDKYAVRSHIDRVLGEGHLFPLLGKWEAFDEIDFSKLPDSFVLKCNHDSGSVQIIRDKAKLSQDDMILMKKKYDRRMKEDFFYAGREYPYRGIKKRYIIAEQLMVDEQNPDKSLEDYKFFCFDGVPRIMYIASDRSADCRYDFFDMDFNHLDVTYHRPQSNKTINKPPLFNEMRDIAEKLSQGMRQVRIDLYAINGTVYFGEFTMFHGGGFELLYQEEWEKRLGDNINTS